MPLLVLGSATFGVALAVANVLVQTSLLASVAALLASYDCDLGLRDQGTEGGNGVSGPIVTLPVEMFRGPSPFARNGKSA